MISIYVVLLPREVNDSATVHVQRPTHPPTHNKTTAHQQPTDNKPAPIHACLHTLESKRNLKESAQPTAAKGTMVALKTDAMRTNSLRSGQKRR